jgi:hypothetical protein
MARKESGEVAETDELNQQETTGNGIENQVMDGEVGATSFCGGSVGCCRRIKTNLIGRDEHGTEYLIVQLPVAVVLLGKWPAPV